MEKELVRLFEAAKKVAGSVAATKSSGPEEDRCMDALKRLKNFPVNYEVLKSTQIGKRLRLLTKHPCKKLQVSATEVMETWKKIIVKETAKSPKNCSNSLTYTKDQLRDKVRNLLAEALCKVCSEVDETLGKEANSADPYKVAESVETAMFENWGRFNGAHKFKYRSLLFNIKDPKNPDFRRKVLLGDHKPKKIVGLTTEEMASEERQKQNEMIRKKAMFDCQRSGPPKASTDRFRCSKCGKSETTYYQMQTRSADEPMTTFVTCVVCKNRWKF